MSDHYKVLRERDGKLLSPYQDHEYRLDEWQTEQRVGEPGESGCVRGLYATPIEGLIYRGVWRADEHVYRCEVGGRSAGEAPLKLCHERLRVVGRVEPDEVRRLARAEHERLGWLLEEALYPVDPRAATAACDGSEIDLLRQWASVRDSVGVSVRDSVRVSVWASVGVSVRDSVWDSVGAYIGSLFPRVSSWQYVKHAPGEYPYAAGATLWRRGLVPSHDRGTWRLHAGPDMRSVWSGTVVEMGGEHE